jgi:hypothetical protein
MHIAANYEMSWTPKSAHKITTAAERPMRSAEQGTLEKLATTSFDTSHEARWRKDT